MTICKVHGQDAAVIAMFGPDSVIGTACRAFVMKHYLPLSFAAGNGAHVTGKITEKRTGFFRGSMAVWFSDSLCYLRPRPPSVSLCANSCRSLASRIGITRASAFCPRSVPDCPT